MFNLVAYFDSIGDKGVRFRVFNDGYILWVPQKHYEIVNKWFNKMDKNPDFFHRYLSKFPKNLSESPNIEKIVKDAEEFSCDKKEEIEALRRALKACFHAIDKSESEWYKALRENILNTDNLIFLFFVYYYMQKLRDRIPILEDNIKQKVKQYKEPMPAEDEKPVKEDYVFRRKGTSGWEIVFEGKKLPPLTHLDGYEYYRFLFKHKDKPFKGIELIKQVKGQPEIKTTHPPGYKIRPGEENDNIIDRNDYYGDSPSISIGTPTQHKKKAYSTVYQCMERAKKAIRECGEEAGEKLWIYLKATVDSKNGFVYHPVLDPSKKDISWILE